MARRPEAAGQTAPAGDAAPPSAAELERRKLALEIRDLERPLWTRPGFIIPLLAAVLSIGTGYFSGWFDIQRTRLQNERSELRQDIRDFETRREVLDTEVAALRADIAGLDARAERLRTENVTLSEIADALGKTVRTQKAEIGHLETEIVDARARIHSLQEREAAMAHRLDQTLLSQLMLRRRLVDNARSLKAIRDQLEADLERALDVAADKAQTEPLRGRIATADAQWIAVCDEISALQPEIVEAITLLDEGWRLSTDMRDLSIALDEYIARTRPDAVGGLAADRILCPSDDRQPRAGPAEADPGAP